MRSVALVAVSFLLVAGCFAGPDAATDEPTGPADTPPADPSGPGLPAGVGAVAWQAEWTNDSGPAVTPPEPGGPFVHDATLTLEGDGDAVRVVANVTTETETILNVRAVPGATWRLTVLHHHHGFTQDEADERAASLHNDYRFLENGTRLDMYVDTADASVASAGAQTEIYLTFEVPGGAELAVHVTTHGTPVSGPIMRGSLRDVCVPRLSLAADGYPILFDYVPACRGELRLANTGGDTEARLDDSGDAAYRGRATSPGGEVEVDLAGVEFEEDTTERKVFDTPGWAEASAPTEVAADAGGGVLRLVGCGQWECPGGG